MTETYPGGTQPIIGIRSARHVGGPDPRRDNLHVQEIVADPSIIDLLMRLEADIAELEGRLATLRDVRAALAAVSQVRIPVIEESWYAYGRRGQEPRELPIRYGVPAPDEEAE